MAEEVTVVIEDAQLIWLNFSGRERKFNLSGDRNFCVKLSDEDAKILSADGWNVKMWTPKSTDDDEGGEAESFYYLKISVVYRFKPPTVVIVADENRTMLEEEDLELLDWGEFKTVDLIFRAYDWTMSTGASGRKAELKKLFAVIELDPLDRKYGFVGGPQ